MEARSDSDVRPELTEKQVQTLIGFDCAVGSLTDRASRTGDVPKTSPLKGRWVTVTGGDARFIKKSIASGMLGSAGASKIQADVDTKRTGGMFL